jgi:broad specificity phosphatase PhoE
MNSHDNWDKFEWLSDARSLLEWVSQLGDSPSSLLVRHSERLVNLNPSDTLKAELTPAGHEMAREFGRRLPKGKTVSLFHSPNIRTTQTAERITEGVAETGGTVSEIIPMDILWGPNSDYYRFAALLKEHGFPEVYRRWMNGEIPPDVFEPIDQYIERFSPCIIDRLEKTKPDSIDVLITHDLVIDIAQRKFMEINTDAGNFDIPFLGGLGFARTDGRIIGRHDGSDFPLNTNI